MKLIIASIAAGTLLATTIATAQSARYTVTDLGPATNAIYVSPNGIVSGSAPAADGSIHATLWYKQFRFDIGIPGLGGPNSIAFGVNSSGQAVGGADTAQLDPTGADFCGFRTFGSPFSGFVCAPFLWENGVMSPLPTLGGYNGTVSQINARGVSAGETENAEADPDCPAKRQFKPVKWRHGTVRELPTYPGDPDAVAYAINDNGQVVGSSGTCSDFNPTLALSLHPLHAILWQADGSAIHLGSLGGSGYGLGNLAINLNNRGHVVGTSDIAGDEFSHAFLWTKKTGIRDLGTLPGDVRSGAVGINDSDTVVGISLDAEFNPHAFVWQDGVMYDLNTVVRSREWSLLNASSINDDGQIIATAVNKRTGEPHAVLITPREGR